MQAQLNRVIEKHCVTLKEHVATLGGMLAGVARNAADPLSAVREAEALAHQLKGSSGTAGFHDISRAATALDDYLKVLCRGSGEAATAGVNKALELFQSLDRAALGATPGTSTLYKAA
jgi:HPt (histidine-containing phosphotransfer) domain-containing protein